MLSHQKGQVASNSHAYQLHITEATFSLLEAEKLVCLTGVPASPRTQRSVTWVLGFMHERIKVPVSVEFKVKEILLVKQ